MTGWGRRMTSGLGEFVRMPWGDRGELVTVVALALLCESLIRWRPLPALAHMFSVRLGPPDTEPLEPLQTLPEWALVRLRMTRRVMRNWPLDGVCLRHALVAGQRIKALDPVLRIGVARGDGGRIDAHAWLEIDGRGLDVRAVDYLTLPL